MLIDATGVGDPIVEDLRKASANVQGFKFTSSSKDEILTALAVELESGKVRLPGTPAKPVFAQLDSEMRGYGWNVTAAGTARPGPRDGGNDDSVMALALAAKCARGYGGVANLSQVVHHVNSAFPQSSVFSRLSHTFRS